VRCARGLFEISIARDDGLGRARARMCGEY
jgi:hypothetical protein